MRYGDIDFPLLLRGLYYEWHLKENMNNKEAYLIVDKITKLQ